MKGTVVRVGDNINTDDIIPARFLVSTDEAQLAAHIFEDLDPGLARRIRSGTILVAGANFGCGSSREHAPKALRGAGVACVVAASFARIFFRNAINIGLPIVECPDAAAKAGDGDELEVDLEKGVVRNLTRGSEHKATPYPPFMQELMAAGGLMKWVKERYLDA